MREQTRPGRRPRGRPSRRIGAVAAAAALSSLLAGPALAHPFVRGGEVPVDSLATLTLAMAHGCGSEDGGQGESTTEVALEVPDWMRVVDVPAEDGWAVTLTTADDGHVEVVTWTADGADEPAPDFDLDVVVTGEVGEVRHLPVFQGCAEGSYRWIGTPDEPADEPAVRVTLAAADPDSAPPPEPVAPPEDPDDPADPEDPAEPVEPDVGEAGADDEPSVAPDPDPEPVADGNGGLSPGRWAALALVLGAALALTLAFARRAARGTRDTDTTGAGRTRRDGGDSHGP